MLKPNSLNQSDSLRRLWPARKTICIRSATLSRLSQPSLLYVIVFVINWQAWVFNLVHPASACLSMPMEGYSLSRLYSSMVIPKHLHGIWSNAQTLFKLVIWFWNDISYGIQGTVFEPMRIWKSNSLALLLCRSVFCSQISKRRTEDIVAWVTSYSICCCSWWFHCW